MASITLNKPSGGQLTLSPEDGTSNETVTIPSVGVGKVLQVVHGSYASSSSMSSDAWADTNVLTSITPLSATSKLLVTVHMAGVSKFGANCYAAFRITRDGIVVCNFEGQAAYDATTGSNSVGTVSTTYLDTNSHDTSSMTYRVQWVRPTASGTIEYSTGSVQSTITVMEVAV